MGQERIENFKIASKFIFLTEKEDNLNKTADVGVSVKLYSIQDIILIN